MCRPPPNRRDATQGIDMYLDHFGLERLPFKITPDPRLFYSGGKRGVVLDALVYTITSGEGIIKVVGEVGSGKTMLCRMLETRLPDNVEIVYIANPSLSPDNILQVIAFELKLTTGQCSKLEAMQTLQDWLLKQHASGRQVVVFIEEAQGMPIETLEEIRLLSNLETDESKLLQIVMFGQPELNTNLSRGEIRQLRERISHSFFLTPLNAKDILEYLNFRMRSAGYKGPDLFNRACARMVARYSRGLVRRVNIIADKALLAAFADNTNTVRKSHIRLAVKDSAFSAAPQRRWVYALASCLFALAIGAPLAYMQMRPAEQLLAVTEPAPATPAISEPTVVSVEIRDSSADAQPDVTAPVAQADEIVAPKAVEQTTVAALKPVSTQRAPEAESPTSYSEPLVNVAATKAAEPEAISVEQAVVETLPAALMHQKPPADYNLQVWLQAAQRWLADAPRKSYSIQLLTVAQADAERLQGDLQELGEEIELDKIYIYKTEINENPMLGVLYNEYRSYQEAMSAIDDLPPVLRANGPFLRTVDGLRADIEG